MSGKPTNCFICGAILIRTKEWKEDYCRKHEGTGGFRGCSGWADWGVIMEDVEKGFIHHGSPNGMRYDSEQRSVVI